MKRTQTRAAPSDVHWVNRATRVIQPDDQRSGLGLSNWRVHPGSSPSGLFPEGTMNTFPRGTPAPFPEGTAILFRFGTATPLCQGAGRITFSF